MAPPLNLLPAPFLSSANTEIMAKFPLSSADSVADPDL